LTLGHLPRAFVLTFRYRVVSSEGLVYQGE
jgi:hypothetical protein